MCGSKVTLGLIVGTLCYRCGLVPLPTNVQRWSYGTEATQELQSLPSRKKLDCILLFKSELGTYGGTETWPNITKEAL
ncbi:hypothetical protein SUGI_0952270 [Cryptomeria japonica]|nr:hypothetical protein SUGI_0952270 [Cryptomeria japonica]